MLSFLIFFVYQLLYSVVSSYGGAVNGDISIFLMYFLVVDFSHGDHVFSIKDNHGKDFFRSSLRCPDATR